MIKRCLIPLFLLSLVGSTVEWGDCVESDLYWGDSICLGGYTIGVADFSRLDTTPRMVLLNLYLKDELIATRALKAGENFTFEEEVMVSVENIRMEGTHWDEGNETYARVKLQLRAAPELLIRMITDKDFYQPGEEIRISLDVMNCGIGEATDIEINLRSDPPLLERFYSRSSMQPGEAWNEDESKGELDPIRIKVLAPCLPSPAEFRVIANAHYTDQEGHVFESWGGTVFTVYGPLEISKHTKEIQRLGDEEYVQISLWNNGDEPLKVKLTDSTGSSFSTDSTLKWEIELQPDGTEAVRYKMSAKKTGEGQILPPALAVYTVNGTNYEVASTMPVIDVIGPFLEVKRSATSDSVSLGKEVFVSVDVLNAGNRRAHIFMKEKIPDGLDLLEGVTEVSELLLAGESATFNYTLLCNEAGTFEIPATKVSFYDEKGVNSSVMSSPLRITVKDCEEEDVSNTPLAETLDCDAPVEIAEDESAEIPGDSLDGYNFFVLVLAIIVFFTFFMYTKY